MYYDILILQRLVDGAAHGYEIKKHVQRVSGATQSLNNNVLYPTLRRFEQQGAIRRVAAEAAPGRPPRTIYQLTDTGRDLLQALLEETGAAVAADDGEFLTRVAFFDQVDVETRLRLLAARRAVLLDRLANQRKLQPEASGSGRWAARIVSYNLEGLERQLGWLDQLTALARSDPGEEPDGLQDGA